MKRVLFAILVATSTLMAAPPPETPALAAPAFDIAIDVHPTSRDPIQLLRRPTPSTYTCEAIIATIPASRDAFVHAKMIAQPGHAETLTQKFGDGYAVKFTVTIGARQRDANAAVEISRAGHIVARQGSRVMLQQPENAVKPAQ